MKDTTQLDQLHARRAEAQDCFDATLNHILHIKKSADAADCKMLRQQQLAADATARLATEKKRSDDLAAELAASRTALSNAETSISQLQEKVAQAVRDHQTAVTHLRDDFERLRTRVLRRLSRELDLLDEGMGAIRREPPRLHVMLDHGERATSGLREEIKNLEREAQR